jgi:hypothetical protein
MQNFLLKLVNISKYYVVKTEYTLGIKTVVKTFQDNSHACGKKRLK